MSAIAKLAGYRRSSSNPAKASPTPPATATLPVSLASSPLTGTEAEPPSTLHQRLEEFLGVIVDRHAPAQLFTLARQAAAFVPMLRAVGAKLPAHLPEIPASPADVKALIRRELYARPAAELAGILQLAEATVGAWLAEYDSSQTPGNPPAIPEETPDGHSPQPPTAE